MHRPHSLHIKSTYFDYPLYPFRPPPELTGRTAPHPVVIVGAGPVGLIVAMELGRRGIRTVLLEAIETVSPGSRATCVSRRSMEIMLQNQCDEPFVSKALMWTEGSSFYRDQMVYRLRMPHSADERYFPMANIQQCVYEKFLVDRVEQIDHVDLRWQSKVVGLTEGKDTVTLRVDTPEGEYDLSARYVVAADGARSIVRELLGLRLAGESHSGRYLIADIRMASSYPTERRAWFDPPSNPGNTILMHKQPDDIWRIDYQLATDQDSDYELQDDRVRARIKAHLDWIGETAPWQLEWTSLYKAHCLCLDDYRYGRILFAGDAVHLVPIFGVRGMNSGIADANNLGWKLAYVLQGLAPDSLLDSYTPERRAATLDIFDNARKSTLFMTPPTRGYQLTRDAVLQLAIDEDSMKPLINPRQSTPYDYVASPLTTAQREPFERGPRAGAPLINIRLKSGQGKHEHLLDHLGPDFNLLWFGESPAEFRIDVSSTLEGVRVKPILITRLAARSTQGLCVIHDHDGRLYSSFDATAGCAYLIRPDGHVCARWRSWDEAHLAQALRRALTR